MVTVNEESGRLKFKVDMNDCTGGDKDAFNFLWGDPRRRSRHPGHNMDLSAAAVLEDEPGAHHRNPASQLRGGRQCGVRGAQGGPLEPRESEASRRLRLSSRTLAHRPERLLKLPLEGLREFLQDSLAQPWALEDEAVLRHLRASMTQLRRIRCDLSPRQVLAASPAPPQTGLEPGARARGAELCAGAVPRGRGCLAAGRSSTFASAATLFHVLAAYSVYDTEVGYCQGMREITAILLMFLPEEDAFWALAQLMVDDRHAMHGQGADVHWHLHPKVVPAVLPRPDPLLAHPEPVGCLRTRWGEGAHGQGLHHPQGAQEAPPEAAPGRAPGVPPGLSGPALGPGGRGGAQTPSGLHDPAPEDAVGPVPPSGT
ncbi:uncharacterized protein LOC102156346 isoform X3 [Canis lupus familiaris]|uniref:uncharacterized protein LOC102156346 isoform X3 n=1 Tax=Canis lupus familiaris TaxID=9615 RepID=UPI0018F60057|nr:uncharacterized protein LOC102156346 isoform X3 [Canis lupus familiaris]